MIREGLLITCMGLLIVLYMLFFTYAIENKRHNVIMQGKITELQSQLSTIRATADSTAAILRGSKVWVFIPQKEISQ